MPSAPAPVTAGPQPQQTYAERLRGRRFWLPTLACVAALVVSGVVWQGHLKRPPALPSTRTLASVDPVLASMLTRLEANRVFCGDVRPAGAHAASCLVGTAVSRTTLQTAPTHRATLALVTRLEAQQRASFSRQHAVGYLISGPTWVITGVWSRSGYGGAATPTTTAAQKMSTTLNGCLELLPRDAGSCAF